MRFLTAPRRQQLQGLTLIELAVTMVILGVVLAATMPIASDWVRGLRVRSAGESLRSGVELARMEALRRNGAVSFWLVTTGTAKIPTNECTLSSSSAAWVVSVIDPSGACGTPASLTTSPQLVQRSTAQEQSSDLSVSATSSDGSAATSVTFNGLGQVQAGAGQLQLIDISSTVSGGRRLRVVVESGGAIRMCDRDVATGDPRACPAL